MRIMGGLRRIIEVSNKWQLHDTTKLTNKCLQKCASLLVKSKIGYCARSATQMSGGDCTKETLAPVIVVRIFC